MPLPCVSHHRKRATMITVRFSFASSDKYGIAHHEFDSFSLCFWSCSTFFAHQNLNSILGCANSSGSSLIKQHNNEMHTSGTIRFKTIKNMNREQIKQNFISDFACYCLGQMNERYFYVCFYENKRQKNQTANFIWARKESKHCLCPEMAQFGAVTCGSQRFLSVSSDFGFGCGRGQGLRAASMRFEVVIHPVFYVPKLRRRRTESKVSFVLLLPPLLYLSCSLEKCVYMCVLERNRAAPRCMWNLSNFALASFCFVSA